jgi:hypothetical protein
VMSCAAAGSVPSAAPRPPSIAALRLMFILGLPEPAPLNSVVSAVATKAD